MELIRETEKYKAKKKNIIYKLIYNLMMERENRVMYKNMQEILKELGEIDVIVDFDGGASKYIEKLDIKKKIVWIHNSIPNLKKKAGKIRRFGKRLDELNRFTEYDGEIYGLYVKPGLLRKKIGSKLLLYAKESLKEQGNHKMIIWCLKENEPSRKFYERMGGILLGEKMRNIGGKDYPLVGYGYQI